MLRNFVRLNRNAARWLETTWPRVFGAPDYTAELKRRIDEDIKARSPAMILEVGGIDRPLLKRTPHYTYVGLDIEERPDCYNVYDKFLVQSIEDPVSLNVDMVTSITVMEHVRNNRAAVRAIFETLIPGGVTHHYIPSKWHPYSIALRIVGPALQKRLIQALRPDAASVTGYPAFFDHCSPAAMSRLFLDAGFEDVDVLPFYRASDYFAFFLPAYLIVALLENLCAGLGAKLFCSGFVISARKPLPATAARSSRPNSITCA